MLIQIQDLSNRVGQLEVVARRLTEDLEVETTQRDNHEDQILAILLQILERQ